MLSAELEFIASEELVEIIPTVRMDKIQFITVSELSSDPLSSDPSRANRGCMVPFKADDQPKSRCGLLPI